MKERVDRQARTATDKVVNRHMARLLNELTEAGCPVVFVDTVKSKMIWLRSDLNELGAGYGQADSRDNSQDGNRRYM